MATSVLSNVIKDPSGTPVVGAVVVATLRPGPGFRTSDSSEIAGREQTVSDSTGSWSLTLERNADIYAAGSYWSIEEHIPDIYGGPKTWNVTVGAADANVRASLITELPPGPTPEQYLTQTQGDARYETPTGATAKVNTHDTDVGAHTGTLVRLPQATDQVIYVGRGTAASDANDGLTPYSAKATIAAAITALGTNRGKVVLGWGVFGGGFTIFDNTIVEGVGVGSSIEGSDINIVTLAGRSVLRDCQVKDNNGTTGGINTVGVRIDATEGIWKWRLERVFILGSLGPGVSNYVGTGLFCDFALEGQIDGCVIEFWNRGVHLQNASNANEFHGCKVRQNNTGIYVPPTVGTAVSALFMYGCVIEGNDTGVDCEALRFTSILCHYENNTGASPTNIKINGTCEYIGFGNEYHAAGANRDIIIATGNTAAHRSYGELLNNGITHDGTAAFVVHEPYLAATVSSGTGPVIIHRNGTVTGRNMGSTDHSISGFQEAAFGQPVRVDNGAVSSYIQADSAGGKVLMGTLSNHLLDLIVGYVVALRLRTDATIATEETAMVLRVNRAGVISNQIVKLGASGTGPGGVGRMLYTDA